eukprot:2546027-Pyramimonas_sp.AAC.1
MHVANEQGIDFTIAGLLDGNMVARWGLRTASAAPTSQNMNTNDAYYIERQDEVPPHAEDECQEECHRRQVQRRQDASPEEAPSAWEHLRQRRQ